MNALEIFFLQFVEMGILHEYQWVWKEFRDGNLKFGT